MDLQEPQRLATILDEVINLQHLSKFAEALRLLEEVPKEELTAQEHVDIARAAARIHINRGYPQLAKTQLQSALEEHGRAVPPDVLLKLRVHLAHATITGCGELWSDEDLLQQAHAIATDPANSTLDHTELVAHVSKIAIVRHTFCHRSNNDIKPVFAPVLDRLVQAAVGAGRWTDLWSLFAAYASCHEKPTVLEFLDATLARNDVSIPMRGLLALERAERSHRADLAQNLDVADTAFVAADHAFGAIEVRRQRLYHGITPISNVLHELVKILNQCMKADYPLGVLRAAPHLLDLALRAGKVGLCTHIQGVLRAVCETAGIIHERLLLEVQLLAAFNATAGRWSTVMELSASLYVETTKKRYWSLAYLVGQVRSLAMLQGGQRSDALKLAQELHDMCSREKLQALSGAELHLAVVRVAQAWRSTAEKVDRFRSICADLDRAASVDREAREYQAAAQKLCYMADLQLQIACEMHGEQREPALRELHGSIASAKEAVDLAEISEKERCVIFGSCDELLVRLALAEGKTSSTNKWQVQAVSLCDRLIARYEEHDMPLEGGVKYIMRAMCHQQSFQKEVDFQKRSEILVAVEKDLQEATSRLEALDALTLIFTARHSLARVYVTAWELFRLDSDVVYNELDKLEAVADRQRKEQSMPGSLDALLQKQQYTAGKEVSELYGWASGVSILASKPEQLWRWSQKRRARSLADLLGLGVLMPESMRQVLANDKEAADAFEQLEYLSRALQSCSENEKPYVRQHIEDLEVQLSSHIVFKDFLTLRDGRMPGLEQIQRLAEVDKEQLGCDRRILFVDWVAYQSKLYASVVDYSRPYLEQPCKLVPLSINESSVSNWLQAHFVDDDKRRTCLLRDDLEDPTCPMRQLDDLVAPLQGISSPGDLFIFCPTSALSSIPLHALKMYDEDMERDCYLLQRNPVVYVPSFPTVNLCLTGSLKTRGSRRPVFLGQYDSGHEARLIYDQMNNLAETLSGEAVCASGLTKFALPFAVADKCLVHFHGHCQFNASNILQQALILSEGEQEAESRTTNLSEVDEVPSQAMTAQKQGLSPCDEPCSIDQIQVAQLADPPAEPELLLGAVAGTGSSHFTVEEVFKLQLADALVVMIACESGSQVLSKGDEPLGLVTGFLCAGAASVIGTSWPIPSGSGREFSKHFYEAMSIAKVKMLDLASMLQSAVMEIMDEPRTSAPYHWAGFCLTGSWMLRNHH